MLPPSYCYHTKPSTGELVMIRWCRMGYCPVKDDEGRPITGKTAIEFMQAGNASLGITAAQADAMISSGLADHGYSYIDIDEGWNIKPSKAPGSTPGRDAQGNLNTSDRFPDMKSLTDYVHKKGLKAGIYSSPGPLDCGGYAGSYGHEQQDAKLFATWGFDLLKYDKCSYPAKDNSPAEQQKPYRLMGTILAGLNRDFILNLCQYGDGEVWSWAREVGGHFWRTTGDLGWGPRGVYSLWDNVARDLDKPRDIAKWA